MGYGLKQESKQQIYIYIYTRIYSFSFRIFYWGHLLFTGLPGAQRRRARREPRPVNAAEEFRTRTLRHCSELEV